MLWQRSRLLHEGASGIPESFMSLSSAKETTMMQMQQKATPQTVNPVFGLRP